MAAVAEAARGPQVGVAVGPPAGRVLRGRGATLEAQLAPPALLVQTRETRVAAPDRTGAAPRLFAAPVAAQRAPQSAT